MCKGNDGWEGGVLGDGGGDCVARNKCSIRQEMAVFSMVTNIELNIKTLKGL